MLPTGSHWARALWSSQRVIYPICLLFPPFWDTIYIQQISPFLVSSSVSFDTYIQSCNHHHSQDVVVLSPPKSPRAPLQSEPTQSSPSWHWCAHWPYSFAFPRISYKWNPTACSFWDRLLTLSIMHLKFIHVVVWVSALCSFLIAQWCSWYGDTVFVHSPLRDT